MRNKNFAYVLNNSNIFKAVPKNNPWTHSLQQNKKAALAIAAYFKVCTDRSDNNCFSFTFVYQKGCFPYKTEKRDHHH